MSTLNISVHISSYVSISTFPFRQRTRAGYTWAPVQAHNHVGEGVRMSEGAHRENLAQELAKEGSHLIYEH